ncbi:hypothetical protein OJF2_59850 [Aquisphaera giovannonii]|uniref:Uncharacterized protein n=1 Tax=Aquisphaera giovannonii TaxID=406548 RepID=A0A5B9WAX2_9BACT|nr:glycosyltransferase family 39 protein [Aquisphaera giovannonii]QEH37394.1 hypothetical protein OJF2_59850 [Aquisphaera giovannonii]
MLMQLSMKGDGRDRAERIGSGRGRPGAAVLAGWAAVLLVAAGIRLWGLEKNGYGNPYYAAAARSMLVNPTNFFFASFDPGGFVTVDKPPLALWIQAASAGLFGYGGTSLIVPQAIMGASTVLAVGLLVRRAGGDAAGLIAGLVLALFPISVAIDRDNMPDTILVLLQVLAAGAAFRAIETGKGRWLVASMALIGLGFNAKMLAAFVVLPTFYLAYLLFAPGSPIERAKQLALASCVLVVVALSWTVAVDLTPASRRPYMGGSTNNSALGLALGYNGLGRVFGGMGNMGPGGGGPPPGGPALDADDDQGPGGPPADMAGMPGPGGPFPGGPFPGGPGGPFPGGPMGPGGPNGPPGFGGPPGPLRLLGREMAGQFAWLLPLAVLGGLSACRGSTWRRPLDRRATSIFIWSGWFLTYALIFSFSRGITHSYYTVELAAPLAAMVGLCVVSMWQWQWQAAAGWGNLRALLLSAAIVSTAAWQYALLAPFAEWQSRLEPALVAAACLAAAGGLAAWGTGGTRWQWGRGPAPALITLCAGLAALMVVPAAWSLMAVAAPGMGMMPAADPFLLESVDGMAGPGPGWRPPGMRGGPGMELMGQEGLADFLAANHRGERYFVATSSSMPAAPLIIRSGLPVMAVGGFSGQDPILTTDQFASIVEAGELRFAVEDPRGPGGPGPGGPGGGRLGRGPGGPGGPGVENREINEWIRKHGKLVGPEVWGDDRGVPDEPDDGLNGGPPGFPGRRMRLRVYDLHPERGLVRVGPVPGRVAAAGKGKGVRP